MSAISLGSSMPLADNGTRDGRNQNRRVEILVYE
jgi:flagellar motor protein MotB